MMKVIVMTGPPYSGKGTQCELLEESLNFRHISTGERCRAEKEAKTNIGIQMAHYEEKGEYVPDSTMKELLGIILDENKGEKGVILDGYPRTKAQVDDLVSLADSKGIEITKVLNIQVPESVLLERAHHRAQNSDREDDKNPETHIKRIRIFESLTIPAIEYLKQILPVETFSGEGEKEGLNQLLLKSIGRS